MNRSESGGAPGALTGPWRGVGAAITRVGRRGREDRRLYVMPLRLAPVVAIPPRQARLPEGVALGLAPPEPHPEELR